MDDPIEYPDTAGYPDGTGFLDEGNAALVDEVTLEAERVLDTPSAEADFEITIRHATDEQRYIVELDDHEIATLRYETNGDRTVLLTTTVDPELRGRGVASDLIAHVLDELSESNRKIEVRCPVVQAYLAAHPEYAPLVD